MKQSFLPKLFLLIHLSLFLSLHSYAQGCSDAGFCTMGAMRPDQHFSKKLSVRLRSIEISEYYAFTKFDDRIYSTSVDLNFGLSPKWTFQVKLPYTLVYGYLKTIQGLGDFSISFSYQLLNKEKYQISATVGAKVPTSNSNTKNNEGFSLPMYYQTSLGTYDLVLGASLITKNWLVAIGYQQPFNAIGNKFNKADWVGNPLQSFANEYPISNDLIRQADVMLRIEKNFRFSRFNAHIGVLNIYRLEKDQVRSFVTNEYGRVNDSDGLVMNILGGIGYKLNSKNSIKLLGGYAAIKRERNPDGLSREFVLSMGYQFLF